MACNVNDSIACYFSRFNIVPGFFMVEVLFHATWLLCIGGCGSSSFYDWPLGKKFCMYIVFGCVRVN